MNGLEQALTFRCADACLLGILHRGAESADTGVVVVVGGPQYRVGSHRQFVLLARYLARNGLPVLRFDHRGMGDSENDFVSFENIDADINSAINAFCKAIPELQRIVIWGLCDAASAAMFYAHQDPRVVGLVLLNPWMRTEATQAKTYLRHYYISHLKEPQFWRSIFGGRVSVVRAARAFVDNLSVALRPSNHAALGSGAANKAIPYPERMLRGLEAFKGQVLLILSGNDLTAKEFKDAVSVSHRWRKVLARPTVARRELAQATHTFSSQTWRDQVAAWTLDWLCRR